MIAEQVAKELESAGVVFESLAHKHTQTASAEARALGIAPDAVAKTVVLDTPDGCVRAVLPASGRLDFHKVRTALNLTGKEVGLLDEKGLAREYPEFEVGAVHRSVGGKIGFSSTAAWRIRSTWCWRPERTTPPCGC